MAHKAMGERSQSSIVATRVQPPNVRSKLVQHSLGSAPHASFGPTLAQFKLEPSKVPRATAVICEAAGGHSITYW